MEAFLAWLEATAAGHAMWAYGVVALSSLVENLFPPAPGDTVTIFAAYLVGRGALSLWPVLFATFFGGFAGFMAYYAVGRRFGRAAIERLGWARRSENRFTRAEDLARRHGLYVVLANRFLPGLRSVVSLTAGTLRMPAWRVALATAVSNLAWHALLIGGGVWAGANWTSIVRMVARYNRIVGTVLAVLAIFGGIVWIATKRRKRGSPPGR